MTLRPLLPALLAALAPAAFASAAAAQDAAAGEAAFARQCVACHVAQTPEGEVVAGRAARTGPNLWGVVGRTPGTHPDFDYGESIVAYGATGVVWEEAALATYLLDPTAFLREALGDDGARSKMAFKVRDEADAADIAAYLATLGETAE